MDIVTALLIVLAFVIGALVGALIVLRRRAGVGTNGDAAALQRELDAQRELHRELAQRTEADARAREAREQREQAVLRALSPVRETLVTMQQKIDDLERERVGQYGALSEQLRRAHESDELLRSATSDLAGALRSGATRGVWGEVQLRRIVEAAGMLRHVDFDLQQTISSDAGTGRPDLVVKLPGNASLAVDAKAPLDAFLEASTIPPSATGAEGERRSGLLARHVRAVRSHVDALSKKAYWSGLDASPEFVVCFLPSESIFAAAIDEDPGLLEYAFSRRVALASPTSLWTILKTVAHTWGQQEVSADARRLFALGTELYDRLGTLSGHADDLRRAIERTVESYNRFVGTLESRVLVTARRIPGIDDSALGSAPAAVETATRRFTAPELTGFGDADLGEVRTRAEATESNPTLPA